jgi:hypothetical protein
MMTLFVLFGDDIKLLSAPRTVDADFAVAYAVCLFAFIFELVVNSWSRTEVTALRPRLEWEGYLFSFFWWLDLIAILTMFADVDFIGEPLGISEISNNVAGGNSNYGRAGRVIRLVRLVSSLYSPMLSVLLSALSLGACCRTATPLVTTQKNKDLCTINNHHLTTTFRSR